MVNSEKFFRNTDCKYFPCHKGVEEEEFNCLFCYCPLYFLGEDCGGDFKMKNGIKSCVNCSKPHRTENFEMIKNQLKEHIKESSKNIVK
ncbi:MAG: cysteine-rich small domain-containing protein [Lachnospiraceae bacterium]|nr:cysteine-rich small domain-containing protein [Lachnospiraceae bacterium]